MKKILIGILSLAALFVSVSCEDMLEEKNYGNPTIEEIMSNPDNAVMLVGQAYADIKWLHDHWGYWGVASLTSDECLCPVRLPGKHWADGGYWSRLNNHTWNPMAGAFENIWNTTISGAVGCNKTLSILEEYKDVIPQKEYDEYSCELGTLRSYYFYMLFDCFGRIPYTEDFKSETKPLMSVPEVWARLVSFLENAAPKLPVINDSNRSSYYGRVTQGFAYALLARLYLNAESFDCTVDNVNPFLPEALKLSSVSDFYTRTINCCDKVIDAGSYKIEEDWFSNFLIDNASSKENIFVIVEDGSTKDERSSGSMSNKLRIVSLTLHYEMQKGWKLIEKPWNGFCARPSFIDRYNERDLRGPGNEGLGTNNTLRWGWFVGPIYDEEGNIVKDENKTPVVIKNEIDSSDGSEATWNDGARMLKYEVDKEGVYKYSENDFVLFRYADVLWMREEAVVRGGSGTSRSSDADFQLMLKRVFAYESDPEAAYVAAYGSKDSFSLDFICDERGREFAWENIRRRDLIRFGKFGAPYNQYVKANDEFRKWFPIPYNILEKAERDENGNPIWTQNLGY